MSDNNLTTGVDGEVIPASIVNQYKTALTGDLVPRNTSGIPTSGAGDLGTSAKPFDDLNLSGDIYQRGVQLVPTGTVIQTIFPTASIVWLLANGESIGDASSGADHESAEYEALFELCKGYFGNAGTEVWANGDTVDLPDMRGYFARAWDNSAGVDSGRAINSSQSDQNQSHSHTLRYFAGTPYSGTPQAVNPLTDTSGTDNTNNGAWYNAGSAYSMTSNGGTEVRVKNIALNYLIKV